MADKRGDGGVRSKEDSAHTKIKPYDRQTDGQTKAFLRSELGYLRG